MPRKPRPDEDDRRQRIRRHYEPRLNPGRAHWDVLDWASGGSQEARFAVLVERVPLARRSLLDVGCGLGDLLGYLRECGIACEYTGVDISEAMVAKAQQIQPGGQFVCADVFADDEPLGREAFDVVFCSGTLNLNLGNNQAFLPVAVRRLVALARQTAVLNLLHERARGADADYFYYHPEEVLGVTRELPVTVQLIEGYLPNDFTVICRKTT